jgi:hypothetical protein
MITIIAVNTAFPSLVDQEKAQMRSGPQARGIFRAVPYRLPAYILCTLAAILVNYLIGKELGWDTLNYHLYAGFSAVNDRFSQDYFAAGPQSYFNPYAYAPFYLLVKAGIPALLIASLLAAAQSTILWLSFELGVSVCSSEDGRTQAAAGLCAAALSFANPVLMQQLGSSFADITTATLVLAGWLLLAGMVRSSGSWRVICAGLILGGASALKPTNLVHAVAAIGILALVPIALRGRARIALYYALSTGIGFAVVAAPWSVRLERMFANPLFPLMNGLFRSAESPTGAMRHFRFIPDSLTAALWRPFAMVDPTFMVHVELRAPDLRYAVLVLFLAALIARWVWRGASAAPTSPVSTREATSTRVLTALGCGFAADWVLWLSGSGNSRYFLPMACVAAVAIVGLVFHIFATRPKVRNYILVTLFAAQAVQLAMGTEYRWKAVPWGGPWFDVVVPRKLRTDPNLFLTIGILSNSFIAPYLAEGSGMVNFSGGYAFGADGANGARVVALIKRYAPNLRMLVTGEKLYEDAERRSPRRSQVDIAVSRFGLRVDPADCVTIAVNGLPPELEIAEASSVPRQAPRDKTFLLSCHLVPDLSNEPARIAAIQRSKDLVLDRLEDACPKLFQPRRPFTEYNGSVWARRYPNTDLSAWVSHGGVKFIQGIRGAEQVYVGSETDWTASPQHLDCGRRNEVYYATLAPDSRLKSR